MSELRGDFLSNAGSVRRQEFLSSLKFEQIIKEAAYSDGNYHDNYHDQYRDQYRDFYSDDRYDDSPGYIRN